MAQGINVIGYEAKTVAGTAVNITIPSKSKRAFMTCEDAAVRWRADGTAPTADEGHLLAQDSSISFMEQGYKQLLENMKFIADTVTSGKLKITYFD